MLCWRGRTPDRRMQDLGEQLRRVRLKSGLTEKEFAERAGLSARGR